MSPGPKIGLALGSGIARGLVHIGVLEALKTASVPIHLVAGTSMGALIGAYFARTNDIAGVEEIVLKTDWKRLTRLLDPRLSSLKRGLIPGHKIEELLSALIGNMEFKDLRLPFAAVATDVNTGEEVVLRKGRVIDAVRASISIPGIFVPATLEGRYLVDGGITNPVPTEVLRDMGAEFVIAVNALNSPGSRKAATTAQGDGLPDIPTLFDTMIQSLYIMEHEIAKLRSSANITINPDVSQISAFDFHKGREAIRRGYEAASRSIPDLYRLLEHAV